MKFQPRLSRVVEGYRSACVASSLALEAAPLAAVSVTEYRYFGGLWLVSVALPHPMSSERTLARVWGV